MATGKEIYQYLDQIAPFALQMEFDNAGFLVGRGDLEVHRILVALDITEPVVQEAAERGCQLIVSHHPVIFHPVKSLNDETPTGRILLALAEHKIAAICAHTNLDAVRGGVNDCLAESLKLKEIGQLHQDGVDANGAPYGIGRVGTVHQSGLSAAEYAAYVKERLNAASVRFVDTGRPVQRVAVGGGSCGSMLADAVAAECDTFVTADVKYDQYLQAKALGVNLMDAGHYATENVVCVQLAKLLSAQFTDISVLLSERHHEVYGGA
jgi:dinuclear metal center YbgI/SA1388 family protein